jgi:(R,R)-butanediol dehydrogenase / meso-butanediol dehydrogenase / diacetyl reductase
MTTPVGATMRAVRWHARGDVRFELVPEAPDPGPGEARVRVAWCGICGSDVHEYRSGPIRVPLEPHPVTGQQAPITLGHEISGWVVDTGAEVHGIAPGDLVALNALMPCGRCADCAAGVGNRCQIFGHLGMSADGGLADLVTVPVEMVVVAPPGLDPAVVALAEPFAVAVHAVRQLGNPTSTPCTVVGAGAIGLAVGLVLRDRGCEVTMVDVAATRLQHAAQLGFNAVHDTDPPPALAAYVVDCSGSRFGPASAIARVTPGGTVCLAGLPEQRGELDFSDVVLREVVIVGSVSHLTRTDLAPAVQLLAAEPAAAALVITARVPLRRAVDDGLAVLGGPRGAEHAKILVQVAGSD